MTPGAGAPDDAGPAGPAAGDPGDVTPTGVPGAVSGAGAGAGLPGPAGPAAGSPGDDTPTGVRGAVSGAGKPGDVTPTGAAEGVVVPNGSAAEGGSGSRSADGTGVGGDGPDGGAEGVGTAGGGARSDGTGDGGADGDRTISDVTHGDGADAGGDATPDDGVRGQGAGGEGAGDVVVPGEVIRDGIAVAATERWFLRRGIPHFIEDYSAGEDVFTRSLPVLALALVIQLLGGMNLDWPWWANLGALVGTIALVGAGWALIAWARGRPAWQRPSRVGPVELAAFVVLPALPPLVFGGQVGWAVATFAGNLALLGLVYLVTSYGLVPMTRWALGQTIRQLGAVAGLLGRALPLLLLFSVTLFINTEVWMVAASLDAFLMVATVGLFVLVATLFLFSRLPSELRDLSDRGDGPWVVDCCAGTPLEGVVGEGQVPPAGALSRRQQGNVLLVLLFSQGVQVLLVTFVMGLFFLALGAVAIRPEVVASWLGDLPNRVLVEFEVAGHAVVLTRALLNVAIFLASFAGFYFTVYAVIDATYREQFFDGIVGEVRQAVGVRAAYLAVRRRLLAATG